MRKLTNESNEIRLATAYIDNTFSYLVIT